MNLKSTDFLSIAILFILFGIIGGAFGAHALTTYLDSKALNAFHTACDYWIYQGLGLMLLSSIPKLNGLEIQTQLVLLTLGTLLFSLSITFLCLDQLMGLSLAWLGPVTPIGGSLIIIAWAGVLWKLLKK